MANNETITTLPPPIKIGNAIIAGDFATVVQGRAVYHFHTARQRQIVGLLVAGALEGMPYVSEQAMRDRLDLTTAFRVDRIFPGHPAFGPCIVKIHRVYALRAAMTLPTECQGNATK